MDRLSKHHNTFFTIMRRLRAPLLLLIIIMAISVLGMTLIPGIPDEKGQPQYMSFFHALYFMSYTATTIGFGEVPHTFSEEQRLWVLFCIYLSVIGWGYTLGSVFKLLSDKRLQQAINTHRFQNAVRNLKEPFYIVCGYGETGFLICKALDRLNKRIVVIELDEIRAADTELDNYRSDVLTLQGDAKDSDLLKYAGLQNPRCAGILSLTNDDNVNLAVAITTRLLAPSLPCICRAERREIAANMASFGTKHILNPFEKFGHYLELALHSPAAWNLLTWLTGLPGTKIEQHRAPPHGNWVLCGHGRFGQFMAEAIHKAELSVTIIDKELPEGEDAQSWVQGDGTGAEALIKAGIQKACGLICGTANDVDNLSTAVTAKELNHNLFIIMRQNLVANHPLFDVFPSDLNMVPSEIIANECLAILSTPLLQPFLQEIKSREDDWSSRLLHKLTLRFGWKVPHIWSRRVNLHHTPALYQHLKKGHDVCIRELWAAPYNRHEVLPFEVLYIRRDNDHHIYLPHSGIKVQQGDELLLAGTPKGRQELDFVLKNDYALHYILTGTELPHGMLWKWFYLRHLQKITHQTTSKSNQQSNCNTP